MKKSKEQKRREAADRLERSVAHVRDPYDGRKLKRTSAAAALRATR